MLRPAWYLLTLGRACFNAHHFDAEGGGRCCDRGPRYHRIRAGSIVERKTGGQ